MKRLLIALFALFFSIRLFSQSVVVSSYFNAADPRDEWTELVVITDNTDMRGWSIRDDNSSQTGWQTAATFTNNAFWNNMRAGTIIMLWHRPVNSSGVTHPSDVNKADGYVELDLSNATYFSGAALGSSPSWGGATMNIAAGGDVIQLRNASGTHVHALGHISGSPGSDWTALPSPKLNHNNNTNSGDAIYVCPGDAVADYGTTGPQNGTTWTSKNSSTITFGLPNISAGNPIQNTAYWDTLREPVFANQVVAPSSVIPGNPGSISFSWTAATDPNVADGTTGYLILQNTVNTFTPPSDGTTYTTGATIGSATIIAQITSSSTTTYTDNTVMNGNSYYYRVYAYRYGTDNPNGNSYHRSRGRAYTSTFVDVQQVNPLPVEWLSFTGEKLEKDVLLNWSTASECNNDYFTVERATDEMPFAEIGRVGGNGNSSQQHFYSFTDNAPSLGNNYYRIKQTDYNGVFQYSTSIAVAFDESSHTHTLTTWNTESGIAYEMSGWNGNVVLQVYDAMGNLIVAQKLDAEEKGIIYLDAESRGIYFLEFSSDTYRQVKKVIW